MIKNIIAAAIHQRRTQFICKPRRTFLTKNAENSEQLTTYLTENKIVDKGVFDTFKSMVQGEQRVFLFKIHGFSNFFFLSARFQVIGLTIGCIAHLSYFYNQKMQKMVENTSENREKKKKLNFVTGALIFFTIAGNIVTYIMSRRYLKSINYMPQVNKLEFNFYGLFCQDKPYLVELNQIHRVQKKLRDQTVQFSIQSKDCPHTYFSSMGTGWWSNKKIFEYIVDQNPPLELQNKAKEPKIKKMKE